MAELNGLPENAIDKLEKCLDDPDEGVQKGAARAMSWVRPSNTKAVAILAKAKGAFGTRNTDLLPQLERMSPHNEAARQLLLRTLGDDHAETAQEAHRILARLELPADQVVRVWIKALSHADPKVRLEAITALGKLGPGAKPTKSALHERLKKENDYYCKGGIL